MNAEDLKLPSIPKEHQELIDNISSGNIPSCFPDVNPIDDIKGFSLQKNSIQEMLSRQFIAMSFKDAMQSMGMYGYISQEGARYLASKFGPKTRFLDPISGRGWIAKAMRDTGFNYIASDIDSDNNPVTDVLELNAKDSVIKHKNDADVLVLSWPERGNIADHEAAMEWGSDKPILLYGEHGKSCNSQEFLQNFEVTEVLSEFPDLRAKPTIYTTLLLGYYKCQ